VPELTPEHGAMAEYGKLSEALHDRGV
jgi:hypothetical protein